MQFTIHRELLLKVLRIVSGVVERKQHQNPILSHALLNIGNDQLTVVGTDQEIELIGKVGLTQPWEAGVITVPLRKLNDICKALPEHAVLSITHQDDRISVHAGRSRFSLSTLPAEQYPSIPDIEKLENYSHFFIKKQAFKLLIERTAFAMADQDVRYFLNGMLLEIKESGLLSAVAADGHRLASYSIDLSDKSITPARVIVPRKSVLEIMRALDEGEEAVEVILSTNHIRLKTTSITITSKLLAGKFPDYDSVIPRYGDKVVIGQRHSLKEAFHRASALFSEKFRGVRLRLSNNCLQILANTAEQDEVEEDLEVDYQGEELEIGFNVRYLIDFLGAVQSEQVRFTFSNSSNSALLQEVGTTNGIYVLMPMRM